MGSVCPGEAAATEWPCTKRLDAQIMGEPLPSTGMPVGMRLLVSNHFGTVTRCLCDAWQLGLHMIVLHLHFFTQLAIPMSECCAFSLYYFFGDKPICLSTECMYILG